jgi:DNA-binding CsgD family transcriptional regulator
MDDGNATEQVAGGTDRQPGGVLERGHQIARVEEAIDAARSGAGRGVLIEGAAGIGKTSLLRVAADRARDREMTVLTARGVEVEAGLPWNVAVQLFDGVESGGLDFSGAAALAKALFEPEVGARPDQPDPFPILHGLHWLVSNLAQGSPVLLIVDDAHWADRQSLQFANYLIGRVDSMPVSVLLTSRTGEPVETKLLTQLRDQKDLLSLSLEPLGDDAIRAIVAARIPDSEEAFRSALAARVAGNPFLCDELVRQVIADEIPATAGGVSRLAGVLPDGVRRGIAGRLRRLGGEAETLAAAVAVLGAGATVELSRRLAKLDEEALVGWLDMLLLADILTLEPQPRFVHPIVGEVVEEGLGAAERRALHMAAARLLHEDRHAAGEVAMHLLAAEGVGTEPWVVPTLREAAAEAMARGAPERAALVLDRALEEAGEGDAALLLEAAHAQATMQRPRAIELFGAALELAENPGQRLLALAGMARSEYMAGDTGAAVRLGRSALASVPPGEGGAIEAEILSFIAVAARAHPRLLSGFPAILEQVRLGPEGTPTTAEFVRLAFDAMDLALRGDRPGAAAQTERARAIAPVEDGPVSLVTWGIVAFTLINLGRCGEAEEIAERMLGAGRAAGDRFVAGLGYEMRGHARWARGDVVDALAGTEWISEKFGGRWETSTIPLRVFRSLALLEAGRDAEAAAVLDVPAKLEASIYGSWAWLWLPYGRANLAFAAGEPELAAAEARLTGERLATMEIVNYENLSWRPLAVRALARAGRREEAAALAAEDLEVVARFRSPRAAALAGATAGTIEGGQGGHERLLAAIADLDALGAELDAARARLDLGMLRRRLRRPRDARRPLSEAVDICGRLGARRLAAEAEEQLRLAGGRPRRLALSGVGSLTPAQRRVAELAAQGLTNPEVAQALFVSVRTVETHLTATYGKLEIDSREQLSEVLGRTQF